MSTTSNQAAYNGSTPQKPAHTYTYLQPQGAVSGQQGMQDGYLAQNFNNEPFYQPSGYAARQDRAHQQVNAVYAAFNQGSGTGTGTGTGNGGNGGSTAAG